MKTFGMVALAAALTIGLAGAASAQGWWNQQDEGGMSQDQGGVSVDLSVPSANGYNLVNLNVDSPVTSLNDVTGAGDIESHSDLTASAAAGGAVMDLTHATQDGLTTLNANSNSPVYGGNTVSFDELEGCSSVDLTASAVGAAMSVDFSHHSYGGRH